VQANVEGITDSVFHWVSGKNDFSERFLNVLVKETGSQSSNSALDGLSNSLFASVVPTAALFSQIIAHVVNFYLDADKAAQRDVIVGLVEKGANAEVMPYVFEALREFRLSFYVETSAHKGPRPGPSCEFWGMVHALEDKANF
jgi:linoleate 10R-lipoxygenase